jgi:hypothetical protein
MRFAGEQYIDSNGNGSWDQGGNGAYNGVLQATPGSGTVHVRQSLVMVLSNSTPAVSLLAAPAAAARWRSRLHQWRHLVNDTRSFSFAIRDNNPTVFATNRMALQQRRSAVAGRPPRQPRRPAPPSSSAPPTAPSSAPPRPRCRTPAPPIPAPGTISAVISDAGRDNALNCTNNITSGAR